MKPGKSVVVAKSADLSRLRETKFFQAIGPDSKQALSLRSILAAAQASGKSLDELYHIALADQARHAYAELTKLPRA